MSDYELVARTRPKELSKAIQEGVPAVVRGTIVSALVESLRSSRLTSQLAKVATHVSIQVDNARSNIFGAS